MHSNDRSYLIVIGRTNGNMFNAIRLLQLLGDHRRRGELRIGRGGQVHHTHTVGLHSQTIVRSYACHNGDITLGERGNERLSDIQKCVGHAGGGDGNGTQRLLAAHLFDACIRNGDLGGITVDRGDGAVVGEDEHAVQRQTVYHAIGCAYP